MCFFFVSNLFSISLIILLSNFISSHLISYLLFRFFLFSNLVLPYLRCSSHPLHPHLYYFPLLSFLPLSPSLFFFISFLYFSFFFFFFFFFFFLFFSFSDRIPFLAFNIGLDPGGPEIELSVGYANGADALFSFLSTKINSISKVAPKG